MKKSLNLSFKRLKHRPNSINMNKLKLWRSLFCIKFVQCIDSKTLIANVDELAIRRYLQLLYSWNQKGRLQEYKNISLTGSINLAWLFWAKKYDFCLLTNQTINSKRLFLVILLNFKKWMIDHDDLKYKKLIVTMDNIAIYKTISNLIERGNKFSQIMLISVNSLQLESVGMWFSFMKHSLKTKMKFIVWKLNNKNKRGLIFESMKSISFTLMGSYFTKFYTELRQHLTF